ncbi:hypothetical protein BX661DRAFT_185518 [Kickxella alabastrina]|uniref:uncharacterized protein n=1 Tax=Kickxella alabastrina TaxID=61397 RepID=UPI00221FCE67|nr:uncharacterized protein BX661DRAFT_185518 [Kickxella alabastrina]KAI7824550.1 hypothetical protein BX661DRAFT_185518 [Kickxella alabastrina]
MATATFYAHAGLMLAALVTGASAFQLTCSDFSRRKLETNRLFGAVCLANFALSFNHFTEHSAESVIALAAVFLLTAFSLVAQTNFSKNNNFACAILHVTRFYWIIEYSSNYSLAATTLGVGLHMFSAWCGIGKSSQKSIISTVSDLFMFRCFNLIRLACQDKLSMEAVYNLEQEAEKILHWTLQNIKYKVFDELLYKCLITNGNTNNLYAIFFMFFVLN